MAHPAWPLSEIARHAEATWPEECCGVVTHDGRYLRLANVAPSPRQTFCLDPAGLLRALCEGAGLRAFVHSHCDAPARLSDDDRQAALADGAPLWPGVQLLVVSVRAGRCEGFVSYAWNEALRDFAEQEKPAFAAGF